MEFLFKEGCWIYKRGFQCSSLMLNFYRGEGVNSTSLISMEPGIGDFRVYHSNGVHWLIVTVFTLEERWRLRQEGP